MRKLAFSLPTITIDPTLVKTTTENNKANHSRVGDLFGYRTPNVIDIQPLALPRWTPEKKPDDWEKEINRNMPVEQVILPKTDLLRTQAQIEGFLRKNYHIFDRPMHYVGHEGNTDNPDLFDTADLKILIVRLSTYDSVNGSMTHGAIHQMCGQAAKEGEFSVYRDYAYMPGGREDCKTMREVKMPWFFGRTSKRHPKDFDVILISCALTLEIWNIIPGLVNSGIAPFKTQRPQDIRLDAPVDTADRYPAIIMGGVVSDFVESLYGKCGGQECVPDITIIGDGEYTLPRTLKLFSKVKKEGGTKRDFFKAGHSLPEDEDFERDAGSNKKTSWWYEPDLYEHIFEKDEKTGYSELQRITRKPGNEHAAPPGQLKRAVVRDLNLTPVWYEIPLQYDGSLGPSVDIQISSGCLCIAGDSMIETDMGFETIEEAFNRLDDPEEIGGVMVQTRHGLQGAEKIVKSGKKKVRTYTFRSEDGKHHLKLTATADHMVDTTAFGDKDIDWKRLGDIAVGQEVWGVDPTKYMAARETGAKINNANQHYYAETCTLELAEIGEESEVETYDVVDVDNHEYIANGIITHNSGGLCSFCLDEDTMVTIKGKQVKLGSLDDITFEGDPDELEFDTPYGLQVPDGIRFTGEAECITLTTARGHKLTCTPDHKIFTHRSGKIVTVKASELIPEKDVAILIQPITKDEIVRDSNARDFLYPAMAGSKEAEASKKVKIAGLVKTMGQEDEQQAIKNVENELKEVKEWLRVLRRSSAYADPIVKIEKAGVRKVYDVWNIPRGHAFYANGWLVSNCHEAHTQGRWRERSLDYIKETAEKAVRMQGAEMVSFYSLTWSLHSNIYSLLLWSYKRFGNTNLISQRADQGSADPNFFAFQNRQGENHATVGVEGMSQRMRNYFNKSLHTDQFIRMCENASKAGYSTLKLFMILSGLETPEDTQEFCELLRYLHKRFKEIAKERSKTEGKDCNPTRLNPSFMLLLSHGHTALQWGPCTSAFDLENNGLRPVVETTRECGFGFRTALTRDRVRHSQWSCMAGRESTGILAEVGLRSNYVNFGPVDDRVTWLLQEKIEEAGYDWMFYFREKPWDYVFPWDGIMTAMRRDYLWNQWLRIRSYVGIAYCLRTSVNPNPKCHDCGACGDAEDRKFMLTRPIENSTMLEGKEAGRRDMTTRKRVRVDMELIDESLRFCLKDIVARTLVRAIFMASTKAGVDQQIVNSFLRVDLHSLKHPESKGALPWVGGHILFDILFNEKWPDKILRDILPLVNECMNEPFQKGKPGYKVHDFVASDKLVSLDEKAYGLYVIDLPISLHDLQTGLEAFDEKESVKFKIKVNVAKDIMRTEEVTRIRSDTVPLAFIRSVGGKTQLAFLCTLRESPITLLGVMTGKRIGFIKANNIICLGIYRYDIEAESDDGGSDDLFAALEGREVYCTVTGQPIETDLFTGELYRSSSAPDLCLAADLKGLMKMRGMGVSLGGATVTK